MGDERQLLSALSSGKGDELGRKFEVYWIKNQGVEVKFWLFMLTLSARAGYGLKDIIIYLAGSEIR